jgi:hypothetical protein
MEQYLKALPVRHESTGRAYPDYEAYVEGWSRGEHDGPVMIDDSGVTRLITGFNRKAGDER